MKLKKINLYLLIFLILCLNTSVLLILSGSNYQNPSENNIEPRLSSNGSSGGRVYTTRTVPTTEGFINRDNPNLNEQPEIYIPNYYISHGNMNFENITALNYTKIIESGTENFIGSHPTEQTFIYQLFSIELITLL